MAYGCQLISDDRTLVSSRDDLLWASAPDAIRGRIEARFFGILPADTVNSAPVSLVVDLGQAEGERLPQQRTVEICGICLPVVHNIAHAHFPAAILQYLRSGGLA
jgi:HPr kinase/phosphorylase